MVREEKRVIPDSKANEAYNEVYNEVYSDVSSSIRSVVHKISDIRGGASNHSNITISPSLLASDWANIEKEVKRCEQAGAPWIHGERY